MTNQIVLYPHEFNQLREQIKDRDRKTQLDFLLLSGMRYIEAMRLQRNPKWFDGKAINLPEEAMKKKKRKQLSRYIRLNARGQDKTEQFLHTKFLPSINGWNTLLKHWAKKSEIKKELSAKVTRKTWESWLSYYYPEYLHVIALSQGHTTVTQFQHYLNIPFDQKDKIEMAPWVQGWV